MLDGEDLVLPCLIRSNPTVKDQDTFPLYEGIYAALAAIVSTVVAANTERGLSQVNASLSGASSVATTFFSLFKALRVPALTASLVLTDAISDKCQL